MARKSFNRMRGVSYEKHAEMTWESLPFINKLQFVTTFIVPVTIFALFIIGNATHNVILQRFFSGECATVASLSYMFFTISSLVRYAFGKEIVGSAFRIISIVLVFVYLFLLLPYSVKTALVPHLFFLYLMAWAVAGAVMMFIGRKGKKRASGVPVEATCIEIEESLAHPPGYIDDKENERQRARETGRPVYEGDPNRGQAPVQRPVWSYKYNGYVHEYRPEHFTGNLDGESNIKVGETRTLYVNPEKPEEAFDSKNNPYEAVGCMGVAFLIFGIIAMLAYPFIMMLR